MASFARGEGLPEEDHRRGLHGKKAAFDTDAEYVLGRWAARAGLERSDLTKVAPAAPLTLPPGP